MKMLWNETSWYTVKLGYSNIGFCDIVSEVKKDRAEEDTEEEDEEGGEECSEVSIPTVIDALEAIRVVNLFYESRRGSSEIVTKIKDNEP
jgi:hypothetical protein